MVNVLSLEEFLKRNRIDRITWEKANIEWPTLQAIANDHEAASENLENSAEFFAKVIQKFNGVHSVRWRVKDSEHLIVKIVRKRSEGNSKYTDITQNNYFDRITDLVGVRALHLFKEDCFRIDTALKAEWTPVETPVVYIREGDSEDLKGKFETEGFEVKHHHAGYRSVHYVIASQPLKRKIFAEIQVRTIFEEGWSEIDHKVRYPDLSGNDLVEYFLGIFNRMAGSADDMGGFVLNLAANLSHLEEKIGVIEKEREATFQDMEQALVQLENVKEQDKLSKESIAKLKKEVAKLKEGNQANRSAGLLGATQASLGITGLLGSIAARQDSLGNATGLLGSIAARQDSFGNATGLLGSTAAGQDSFGNATGLLGSAAAGRASSGNATGLLGSAAAGQASLGITGLLGSTAAKQASLGITSLLDASVADKTMEDLLGKKK